MKRLLLIALMALTAAVAGFAQEPRPSEPRTEQAKSGEDEGNLLIWKWANFGILAGVLGWMIAKKAPAFFASRTEEIQRGIADATKIRQDAEARAANMESRMAALQSEIEQMHAAAKLDMANESERIRIAAGQQMRRIQAHGEQEVASLAKHAENALRADAARLALDLAEQRIRTRMSAEIEDGLVQTFIGQLDREVASNGAR